MANTVKQGISGQTIEQQGSINIKENLGLWNGSEFVPVATEDDLNLEVGTYTVAQVRLLSADEPDQLVTTDFGSGNWRLDASDTTSTDNTGTVLVTASGKRYKRIYDGALNVVWFGVNTNDSVTDQSSIFQSVVNYVGQQGGGSIFVPKGTYNAGINNTYSNITFYMGGGVAISKTWHFAVGKGPDIDPADPNYQLTPVFVENVHIVGTVELIAGGRLGCFYCRNVSADIVRMTGENRGVHIYSHSENVVINECYSTGTVDDNAVTGAVFIDPYMATDSRPKNIRIGKIYSENAYFIGVLVNCDGFTCDEITVNGSGLSGLRVTGSTKVSIGKVTTNNCGITYSTPNNFLRTGVTIDGSSKDVTINEIYATGNYYSQVYVKDVNTNDINLVFIEASSTVASLYSTVYFQNNKRIVVGSMRVSGSIEHGLEIDNVQDCKIGRVESFGNTKNGFSPKGNWDDIWIDNLLVHDNALRGMSVGGTGTMSINTITSANNVNEHLLITGLTGTLKVNELNMNGAGIANSFAGVSFSGITGGTVFINNLYATGFSATSAKGVFGSSATGFFTINNAFISTSSVGVDINPANCSGFTINNIAFSGVTANRTTYPASTINGYAGAGTAAPTTGAWRVGDRWLNSAPATNKPVQWVCVANGSPGTWIAEGYPLSKGITAQRPVYTSTDVMVSYYDTTLNKPIWWNGTAWVDATGATV